MELVYGGGRVGLMGAIADAVLAAGGQVTGIIPKALVQKEVEHRGVQELREVETMHERKFQMAELADAFLAMPGGFGTMDEFCEILTWAQLGIHNKPCGLLNVAGFYDPLLKFFDHAVAEGFLKREHRAFILDDTDPARLVERLQTAVVPWSPKWMDDADV